MQLPTPLLVMVGVWLLAGTLDSGFSRTILEMWCASPLNAVVICGLAMEGTMSKTILQHPKEIDTLEGQYVDFRCEVQNISFNGHADYRSTSHFIRELDPEHVILAHGSSARVEQLAGAPLPARLYVRVCVCVCVRVRVCAVSQVRCPLDAPTDLAHSDHSAAEGNGTLQPPQRQRARAG